MTSPQTDKIDSLLYKVNALPNLIVGPTLTEVFRTLLPMRDGLVSSQRVLSDLQNLVSELQSIQIDTSSKISTQLSSDIAGLETGLNSAKAELRQLSEQMTSPILDEIANALTLLQDSHANNHVDAISKINAHTSNDVVHLLAELNSTRTELRQLPNQIVGPVLEEIFRTLLPVKSAVDTISQNLRSFDALSQKLKNPYEHDEAFLALDTAALSVKEKHTRKSHPKPLSSYYPEAFLYQIKDFKPELYDTWKMLFNAATSSYIEAPNQNCSTWTSPLAIAFRNYVKIYNKGQILDIGCGPHADPMYLQGLPSYRVSALEPLEIIGKPRFPIYRGVNEFIPFKDKSFQTTINATALDHVIDVERALEETARVLDDDGYFIIWYANVTTAPNPVTDFDGPLDDYHLFHTNDEWFLPMLAKHFHTVDRRVYAANATIDNVFAVYQKK